MDETITVNGVEYKVLRENEKISLYRYNEKYKMWVKIFFGNDKQPENTIKEILSKQYISRNTNLRDAQ